MIIKVAVLDGRFYRELSLRQELDPNYKPFMSEGYMEEIRRILEECEKGSPDKLTKRELCKLWKYKLLNQEYKWLSDNFDIFNKIPDIQNSTKDELNKLLENKMSNQEYEWLFDNFDIFNIMPDIQDEIIDKLLKSGEYSVLFDNFDKPNERSYIQYKIIDNCIVKGYYYAIFKNIDKMESYEEYIIEKVGEFGIWKSIAGDICRFLEEKRSSYKKSRDIVINYFFMDEVEKQEKLKKFTEFFEFIKNYEFFSNLITSEKKSRLLAKANSINNKRGSSSTRKAYNNKRTHDKILDNYFYRLALRT